MITVLPSEARALSPPEVHYRIEAELLPQEHLLRSHQTIRYRSGADEPLPELCLHLYPNAFRHRETTLARDARELGLLTLVRLGGEDLGGITVDTLRVNGERAAFTVDETIMRIPLEPALAPGNEVRLDLTTTLDIPRIYCRLGYEGDDYAMAQWYPKMAVLDEEGWHLHRYHALSEFYGEFAVYDVSLTVPIDYYLGATGELISAEGGDNEAPAAEEPVDRDAARTKTLNWRAERVHDFAWVASPRYVRYDTTAAGVPVTVLVFEGDEDKWSKMPGLAARTLEFMAREYTPYPYPRLTVAVADLGRYGGGGMEYPMLAMMDPLINIPYTRMLDESVIHEVVHNWFYGAVASNEADEPWLDEAFTVYVTNEAQEAWYGRERNLVDLPRWFPVQLSMNKRWFSERLALAQRTWRCTEPIDQPAHLFQDDVSYGIHIYAKGPLVLYMLRGVVGDSTMKRIMRRWIEEYSFRHARIAGFERMASEEAGEDLSWFFDQWLRTTGACDYSVGRVRRARKGETHVTTVEVERKGEIFMPVVVEAELVGGATERVRVTARDQLTEVTFRTPRKVKKIVLDPDHLLLETNRLNNESGWIPPVRFHPLWDVAPTDAYLANYGPFLWHDEADGLLAGAWVLGRYLGRFPGGPPDGAHYRTGLWAARGSRSKRWHAAAQYSDPLCYILQGLSWRVGGADRQGVRNRYLGLTYWSRRILGFSSLGAELTAERMKVHDLGYFPDWRWERGTTSNLTLRLRARRRHLLGTWSFSAATRKGIRFVGGGYRFDRGEITFAGKTTELAYGIHLSGRLWAGYAAGDVPRQELFALDGGDVVEARGRFYLNERGPLRTWGRFRMGGGPDLAGYNGRRFLGDRAAALRADLELGAVPGNPALYAGAAMMRLRHVAPGDPLRGSRGKTRRFAEAGLSLGSRLLRLDIPFWVSRPQVGRDDFGWRFTLTFSP